MSENILQSLDDVAETLLIPLYIRALESQRTDAIIKDPIAVNLIQQIKYDYSSIKLQEHDKVAIILRLRKFDRHVQEFLARHADAVVVHIGCGLDTRFERVDNGRVEWYDLDLPEVIALRRRFIGEKGERQHYLSCSMFDSEWLDIVGMHRLRPFLFMAEGVLPYFSEAEVKSFIQTLLRHFPGAELVCDAHTPLTIWLDNLQLIFSKMKARLHWGLKRGKDLESWGDGITLLDEWFYFDRPEPRLSRMRWVRAIPPLAKSTGIFHYQLGQPVTESLSMM